jgi:hypothetical protein
MQVPVESMLGGDERIRQGHWQRQEQELRKQQREELAQGLDSSSR